MPSRLNSASLQLHPPAHLLRGAALTLTPWRRLCNPVFLGLDQVPSDRPLLFVGNHTLYGLLDVPLMWQGLYEQKGIFLRSLGDHFHFHIPGWRRLLTAMGTVEGTRDNCRALMQAGEHILVFPGGGREVVKRKGEKYTLIWKERLGFARMAIEHGYDILPFAAVGAEECFDILYDADDLLRGPLGPWVQRLGIPDKYIPPLARGLGPTLIPRPQQLYFNFGQAIASSPFAEASETNCRLLREQTARSIESLLVQTFDYRYRQRR